jgi:type II secretory ATPase GspE/PulE/Tfp pilus assembly ATPase PilB-like protein
MPDSSPSVARPKLVAAANLPAPPAHAAAAPVRWPSPPFASYPGPSEHSSPLACVIEGAHGRIVRGQLLALSIENRIATVHIAAAKAPVPLRFDQFLSLTLTEPLAPNRPSAKPASLAASALLEKRPRTPYRLHLKGGHAMSGQTIGHLEDPAGLFLFPPVDDSDRVIRMFVPRDACVSYEFGARIGKVLVEQRAATAEQVEQVAAIQEQMRTQKLGELLVKQQIVTSSELLKALEMQARMPVMRVGEALIALGLIKADQLNAVLEMQKTDRSAPLGELLVRQKMITREDLRVALARKMGVPIVDVAHFPPEPEALRRVPFSVAQRLRVLPLVLSESNLVVGIDDVTRRAALDELEFVAQIKVIPALASFDDIDDTLGKAYSRIGLTVSALPGAGSHDLFEDVQPKEAGRLAESLEREGAESPVQAEDKPIEQSDNSLVRLINQTIAEAHAEGASDIHIECSPGREKVKIRFRKDGELRPYLELPHNYRNAIVSRIKIMCDLDISERRKPQDGKINFARFSPQHKLELRVATIPTNNGLEDVVMRLLASAKPLPLSEIGMSPNNYSRLKSAIERPYGMVLCVGPTGSGKTTTLHSALGHINLPGRKIWTAEDPVEITQTGLRQVQVNPKIEWTFAKALRAFLRADPDVIMVGEVRDQETAHMAVEASLTGHLVLSTLHTNTAPETVTRLIDMGLDSFNFADALLAVLAQRLVRRMCTHCRAERPATPTEIDELLADYLRVAPEGVPELSRTAVVADWNARLAPKGKLLVYKSMGCEHCGGSGLRGRLGIHELMINSHALRRLIQKRSTPFEMQACALHEGMRTLRQDGIEKVLLGLTTIEEVRATSNE